VDAIAQVVRVFPAQGGSASGRENITHVYNTIDPQRDIEIINTELILADLETVTKRIAKLEKEARGQNKVAVKTLEIIKNIKNILDEGKLACELKLSDEDLNWCAICSYSPGNRCFLFLNTDDVETRHASSLPGDYPTVAIDIKIEEELPNVRG